MQFKHTITGLALAASVALMSACAPARTPALVTVRNSTAEKIDALTIEVSGESLAATNVTAGSDATLNYSIGAESDYHVVATLSSGRRVEGRVGYVDAGLTSHDHIVIYDDRVEFIPPTLPKDEASVP